MSPRSNRFLGGQTRLTAPAFVFAIALVARMLVAFHIAATNYFLPTEGDMMFYSDWAKRIAGGAWTDHQAFYGLPGYAYLLAVIYKAAGYQPYVVILLQALCEAFTAAIVYQLAVQVAGGGARRSSRLVGWAAAMGWVFLIPAQAYSCILMPTAFLITAFWFTVRWTLRPRIARPPLSAFFGLGLMMGIVAMMVANILFLLPLVGAAIYWREWTGWTARARMAALALLFGGVILGASPCWLHNRFVAGEPVFLSAHGGVNFWLGNNVEANGYPNIPQGFRADQKGMLADSIMWAQAAERRSLRRWEVSQFWSARAMEFIRGHPVAWLKLEGQKIVNYWNRFQYDDLGLIASLRDDGVLLPGFGFGWIAALAIPGMILAAIKRPDARWVMAACALHLASLLTVFITERYRLASAPGLLILAAVGFAELVNALARRTWILPAVYAGALGAGLLVVCHPVEERLLGLEDYNASIGDMAHGRVDRARDRLDRVYAITPDSSAVNFALGNVWFELQDRDKAKYYYRRSIELDPRQERAFNNLGVMAMQEKRWPLAEAFLASSLQLEPDDPRTSYLLAQSRFKQGNLPGARDALASSLRAQPQRAEYLALAAQLKATP